MSEPDTSVPDDATWVVDTGVFIACGRQGRDKYRALERFVRRNELTFVVPQRVHEELGGAPDRSTPGQTPIDNAIEDGWVTVADELDYANPLVSRVMDFVRSYIARESNRSEDSIEKTDTALGGVAADLLESGSAASVYVLTTDKDAGEGVVAALEAEGFNDQIVFKEGFEFIEALT